MNTLTKFTLACAIVLACSLDARAADLRLSIDPGFSMYEKASILQVVNEWNVALKGARRIELAEGDWTIAPSLGSHINDAGHCQAGTANYVSHLIQLDVNCMRRGSLAPVARHEIGHMLGLGHLSRTVMDPECCFHAYPLNTHRS